MDLVNSSGTGTKALTAARAAHVSVCRSERTGSMPGLNDAFSCSQFNEILSKLLREASAAAVSNPVMNTLLGLAPDSPPQVSNS